MTQAEKPSEFHCRWAAIYGLASAEAVRLGNRLEADECADLSRKFTKDAEFFKAQGC